MLYSIVVMFFYVFFEYYALPAIDNYTDLIYNKRQMITLYYTGGIEMKVKDIVNNTEAELSRDELVQKMKEGRQVDLILKEKKTDDIGYLTWDMEQWSTVDGKRFIRTYQLEGRVLSEYTSHNIHDLNAYFLPDEAEAVQLS